jgi:Na+/phosphate symporter
MDDLLRGPIGGSVLAIMYVAATTIAVRRVPLSGGVRWVFGLTVAPLFFFLVWASALAARAAFPEAIAYAESQTFHVGPLRALGSTAVAFIIITPVPVLVCWLWYITCRRTVRGAPKNGV